MNTTEALSVLVDAFTLSGALTDERQNPIYEFTGDFDFCCSEIDETAVRLTAELSQLGTGGSAALKRRLLESNLMGAETGSCRIAVDPMKPGAYAMVDMVDLALLDEDDFKICIIDFILHVEYWRAEGIEDILAEVKAASSAVSETETMIRV